MPDRDAILKDVLAWVKEVGNMQVEKIEDNLKISTKSNQFDLVTEVDQLSENMLIEYIKERYPTHSILSEESGWTDNQSEYKWIIDPIDGTTNYAHGFPAFAISIALQYLDEMIVGVVYLPKLDELYYAVKGKGAFLNDKRIEVSSNRKLEHSLLTTGFPYNRSYSDLNLAYFHHFITKVRGIRGLGSAAYDLCNIAAGRLDGYWEFNLNIWDIAAGMLIVEEAGGKVIHSKKQNDIFIIAGNQPIFDTLYKELKEINPEHIQQHFDIHS